MRFLSWLGSNSALPEFAIATKMMMASISQGAPLGTRLNSPFARRSLIGRLVVFLAGRLVLCLLGLGICEFSS